MLQYTTLNVGLEYVCCLPVQKVVGFQGNPDNCGFRKHILRHRSFLAQPGLSLGQHKSERVALAGSYDTETVGTVGSRDYEPSVSHWLSAEMVRTDGCIPPPSGKDWLSRIT